MKRRTRLFFIGIFVAFLLVFTRGWIERGFHIIQRPLAKAGTWLYKQQYNAEFENRLISLAIDKTEFEQTQKENQELKEALNYVERTDVSFLTASVIARSNSTEISTFLIDHGEQDGIKIGDPVIVKDGVLIGKIASVTKKSATVRTLSDPAVATAVSLLNKSQTIGVAEGMTGNLLRLKFIPQETKIEVNDLVVSSGLEQKIPSGLLIGIINDVRPEENAPFLEAIIEPIVDSRQYSIVQVLIQKGL
ncbi:rod shape-determining protein MreC [Candidatus Uhrbacteria bacterium]|nr:rod shape-determining protein MreC [Candidatus Uhrbacteria bacterium]